MTKSILTRDQKNVRKEIASEKYFAEFYLSGGTALSEYYLHHRLSDDLDFFSFDVINTVQLHAFMQGLKEKLPVKSIREQHLYDRNIFFLTFPKGELKIEFTKYPFRALGKRKREDGILIDSLRDIAANKLMALLDRFDPKDFVDLYILLQQFTLKKIKSDAEKKFGTTIDDLYLGTELMKVRRISALPKMFINISIDAMKDFFMDTAKKLGKNIIIE